MYCTNILFIFSLLGFVLESTIYKINKSKRYSSIFYGPFTYVYGFGILTLLLVKKYWLDHLKIHGLLKVIITFLTCWIVLTFIEWLGGNILYEVFQVNMWNYTKKAFNCGKYICLELSLIWGLIGTLYLYFAKDFFDKIAALIPKKLTITIIILELIDLGLVLFNKLP